MQSKRAASGVHPHPAQARHSVEKNSSFFRDHRHEYDQRVQALDTYVAIRRRVDESVRGIDRLLDIGNGAVFDYDTSLVRQIVAVDLFLDEVDHTDGIPVNVALASGSALALPQPDESFDGVLMVMLLHHLVGHLPGDCLDNTRTAIREGLRVLRPGGRLVVVESCVPHWFYGFERLVFPLATPFIQRVLPHPATLQFPPSVIAGIIREAGQSVQVTHIPKGRWVLQYGFKFPAVLTPVEPYRFVVEKR